MSQGHLLSEVWSRSGPGASLWTLRAASYKPKASYLGLTGIFLEYKPHLCPYFVPVVKGVKSFIFTLSSVVQ